MVPEMEAEVLLMVLSFCQVEVCAAACGRMNKEFS